MSTPETRDPRKEFGAAVFAAGKKNSAIVALSADSGGSSGLGEFQKTWPERYFEFGIMEQGVVGVAAGLATTGKIPVFCAIAPFVTSRPYEMVRNDCGYMKQNVKIVGRNGGITYSDLGSTHHSLEDFALMSMIPGMVVLCPQDPNEIKNATAAMIDHAGPVYMRIGNEPLPVFTDDKPFVIGKGSILREGKDVTLISTGTLTWPALQAAEELSRGGIQAEVIGMPSLSPIDEALIAASAEKTGRIVTVEEHYIPGGLGSIVAEVCARKRPVPITMLGLPKAYAGSGPYKDIMAYYGLDAAGIAKAVRESLGKK
ncbi:MAG: transketolase family protein [Spirochaetaceae bacterium]|nr:transketolase family protein [Spirochaetaceae bacterium]